MELRSLRPEDDRTLFSCGDPSLDEFLRSRAGQQQFRHRAAVTYVLEDEGQIVGFTTVLPGAVRRDELGAAYRRMPPSALPVLLLARMGVHRERQNAGLGGRLLRKVLELALMLSRDVGGVGVLVDAKPAARSFYERYGFAWLPVAVTEGITRGFLPIHTIEAALTG